MGRYTGPVCRMCRREGMKLFLKGDRCFMAKCPIETGRSAPGMHGQRRSKLSDYGVQLREKQRLRRMYGMQEGQFHLFFTRALRKRGVTGETLLQSLECRLDNVVFRLGFAPSRRAARQFVRHGHIQVNGNKVDIPSLQLKAGDIVQVRDRAQSREYANRHMEVAESRGIVGWLALDRANARGEVLHAPTRDEIAPVVREQLIVELYSK
ncbi:MAG TPA: 30S ribosomal protein S4 [Kiritimatiellia bacterium]|nr:30S ribosomal protein S4 [Kiritimatiellia bacterium]HRZ13687.1 30S ribosomal protein S4 [Kiritimatiellia bacterium]HSA19217.1 30S ribosomal protein S4 [Kiritimatiellia bacterium]